jgi:hypothetical protein
MKVVEGSGKPGKMMKHMRPLQSWQQRICNQEWMDSDTHELMEQSTTASLITIENLTKESAAEVELVRQHANNSQGTRACLQFAPSTAKSSVCHPVGAAGSAACLLLHVSC